MATAWCTDDQLFALWPESASLSEFYGDNIGMLLEAAQEACEAYAPKPFPEVIPASYTVAVATQTRNLYNASKVDASSGGFGEGEYSYQPRPLDWSIKQLLRPIKGKPVIG